MTKANERYRIAGALASPLWLGGIAAAYTSGQWLSVGLPVFIIAAFLWFSPELFNLAHSGDQ
jgi:hypothetical protein